MTCHVCADPTCIEDHFMVQKLPSPPPLEGRPPPPPAPPKRSSTHTQSPTCIEDHFGSGTSTNPSTIQGTLTLESMARVLADQPDLWTVIKPNGDVYRGTVEQMAPLLLNEHPLLKPPPIQPFKRTDT